MNPKVIGLLRGLGYAVVYVVIHFIAQNLGSIADPTVSVIVVGILGLIDHSLNDPNPLGKDTIPPPAQ